MRKLLVLSFIFILGCGGEEKKSVETANLVSDFSATRKSNSVTCRAQFWDRNRTNHSLELSGGDQVWCQGNMMVKKQDERSEIIYETEVALEQNLEYTMSLRRPGENQYLAHIKLPAAVKILKPRQGDKLTQGRDIIVEVSPGEKNLDQTNFEYVKNEGGVVDYYSEQTPGDQPSHKVSYEHTSTKSTGTVADITVRRFRKGTQPNELKGDTKGFAVDKIAIELL